MIAVFAFSTVLVNWRTLFKRLKNLAIVPTGSFLASEHYAKLEQALTNAGLQIICMNAVKQPLLSKVNEGILHRKEN